MSKERGAGLTKSLDRKKIFDLFRMWMGKISKNQVARIDALMDGLDNDPSLSIQKKAYILATAFHETDAFRTLTEYASGSEYEGRSDLGNTHKGDGRRFKGRGYVQITGRRNYADWSKRLKVNFLGDPSLVMQLKYAVPIIIQGMILGTFTGKKLDDFFTEEKSDWINARRIVNGLDRAAIIGSYGKKILEEMK